MVKYLLIYLNNSTFICNFESYMEPTNLQIKKFKRNEF